MVLDNPISVGILLFNDIEVLDFAGPFEVFSLAQASRESPKAFAVRTVSQTGGLITACNGLKVQPDFSFETAPAFDILIVPGGYGARAVEVKNQAVIEWIRERAQAAEILASVCTGAFLLAEAGLLDGLNCTTHWMSTGELAAKYPSVKMKTGVRFVDEGKFVTAAGISAGIDMSLHIVGRLLGRGAAIGVAKGMEYEYFTGNL
jgi:transcriptional regulator GlxA family with amidase domain